MKKIAFLISGKLNFFDKNLQSTIELFRDFEVNFFLTTWVDEQKDLIKKFEEIYKPIKINLVEPKNWSSQVQTIKYPPSETPNIQNFFHMWHSIEASYKNFIDYCESTNTRYDYVARFRSDILFSNKLLDGSKILLLKSNELLVPDIYHWKGTNDQFAIMKTDTFKIYSQLLSFINDRVLQKKYFAPEYLLYLYLKKNKLKIRYIDINYHIMRNKNYFRGTNRNASANQKPPLNDRLIIKIRKLFFKLRNFKSLFITRTKIRGNKQNLYV